MSGDKVPLQIRARVRDRELIDRAAAELGKSRSDFVIDSARASAEDVLLDRRTFFLDDADWDAVMAELDRPPSEKLVKLLKSTPVWEK